MNGNSKRLIASVAALEILLYHCWIPVFRYGTIFGSVERFLIASTYSGVDIFFFLSAYSLVSRPVEDYRGFLRNRVLKILPLFFIAWAAGQFLWFLPSIMVLYLLLPPLYPVCRKKPVLSLCLLHIVWAGIVYLFLGVIKPKQDLGIFLFRIPAILLGAYTAGWQNWSGSRRSLPVGILLLAVGTFLVYRYGYIHRLNVPFRGIFYLTGIPVMLGTVLILNRLAAHCGSRVISYFGSITLELYFTQMVFGTHFVNLFFRLTGLKLATNLLAMTAIIIVSVPIRFLNDRFQRLFSRGGILSRLL